MKKITLFWCFLLAFAACSTDEPVGPSTPQSEDGFEITVHEESLTAFSVTFDIRPKREDVTYYYDIISKERWEQSDLATMQAEISESIQKLAELTSTSFEEVLAGILFQGDMLNGYSGSGFRPNTEFYLYAYYWDASGPSSEVTLCAFSTPTANPSTESLQISFEEVTPYSMQVVCEPSLGVVEYYVYFDEATKVKALVADEQAFLSFQAMNYGLHYADMQSLLQQGLKPENDYAVAVMGIDEQGNRFMTYAEQKTPQVEANQRVESELFTTLLGEWEGTQLLSDGFSQPETSTFRVTIVQQVEDKDFDYRAQNQLVALVDGWYNIRYYGVKGLEAEYADLEDVPDPAEAFGPKWLLNIAEGDVITIDGQARQPVIGWMFFGDGYMTNSSAGDALVYTSHDLKVTLSEDGNTLTISSPAELGGCYPSLSYLFTGFGWMSYFYGESDIVLTRKSN